MIGEFVHRFQKLETPTQANKSNADVDRKSVGAYKFVPDDIERASPSHWMSSAHIEVFARCLREMFQFSFLPFSFFGAASRYENGHDLSVVAHVTAIAASELVCAIPVYYGAHFSCYIVDGQTLYYVDSMNGQPPFAAGIVALLRATGRTIKTVTRVAMIQQQQQEGYKTTCGLWACANMLSYCLNKCFPSIPTFFPFLLQALNSGYKATPIGDRCEAYKALTTFFVSNNFVSSPWVGRNVRCDLKLKVPSHVIFETNRHSRRIEYLQDESADGSTDVDDGASEIDDPTIDIKTLEPEEAEDVYRFKKTGITAKRRLSSIRTASDRLDVWARLKQYATKQNVKDIHSLLLWARRFAAFDSESLSEDEGNARRMDVLLVTRGRLDLFLECLGDHNVSPSTMINACDFLHHVCGWQQEEAWRRDPKGHYGTTHKTQNGVSNEEINAVKDHLRKTAKRYHRVRRADGPKIQYQKLPNLSEIGSAIDKAMLYIRDLVSAKRPVQEFYSLLLATTLVAYFIWIQAKRPKSTAWLDLADYQDLWKVFQQTREVQYFASDKFKTRQTYRVEALMFDEEQFDIINFYLKHGREPLVASMSARSRSQVSDALFINMHGNRVRNLSNYLRPFSNEYLQLGRLSVTEIRKMVATAIALAGSHADGKSIARATGHSYDTSRKFYVEYEKAALQATIEGQAVYAAKVRPSFSTTLFRDISGDGEDAGSRMIEVRGKSFETKQKGSKASENVASVRDP